MQVRTPWAWFSVKKRGCHYNARRVSVRFDVAHRHFDGRRNLNVSTFSSFRVFSLFDGQNSGMTRGKKIARLQKEAEELGSRLEHLELDFQWRKEDVIITQGEISLISQTFYFICCMIDRWKASSFHISSIPGVCITSCMMFSCRWPIFNASLYRTCGENVTSE